MLPASQTSASPAQYHVSLSSDRDEEKTAVETKAKTAKADA